MLSELCFPPVTGIAFRRIVYSSDLHGEAPAFRPIHRVLQGVEGFQHFPARVSTAYKDRLAIRATSRDWLDVDVHAFASICC
jgi:hypothetical protein